jgi:hypothetical protein
VRHIEGADGACPVHVRLGQLRVDDFPVATAYGGVGPARPFPDILKAHVGPPGLDHHVPVYEQLLEIQIDLRLINGPLEDVPLSADPFRSAECDLFAWIGHILDGISYPATVLWTHRFAVGPFPYKTGIPWLGDVRAPLDVAERPLLGSGVIVVPAGRDIVLGPCGINFHESPGNWRPDGKLDNITLTTDGQCLVS